MRNIFNIINALQPLHWFILLVVGVIGTFGTYVIGHYIEEGAIESWIRQAELDVAVATTTAQSWLAQSETIISGLALGFRDPQRVTTEEFENLVFLAEDWNSEFSLDAVAIVQRVLRPQRSEFEGVLGSALAHANDPSKAVSDAFMHMVVVKSTETEGPLRPLVDLLTMPEMGAVATTAQRVPDKAILGPAFTGSNGRLYSLVGISLAQLDQSFIVVGQVDLSEFIENLLSNYVPDGLVLRISERDSEARAETLLRPIYGPLEAGDDTVHTVTIRVTRGQARWNYDWDVTPEYLGGAPTATVTMVQIGGLIITVLVVYTIGLLSFQNSLIKAEVKEQTKELTHAKAMLLQSHDQLEGLVTQRTAALQESEAGYREIFEESPVGIRTEDWSQVKQAIDRVTQDGAADLARHLDANPEFLVELYELSGYKTEISRATLAMYQAPNKEALQKDRGERITAEELSMVGDIMLSFLSGKWNQEFEGPHMLADGEIIHVHSRLVMPPRHRDDWSRVIYAIDDISERKLAESELRQAEEQLRQAQKMEAIGQLTGGVAHDFNNLLAIIQGNAELLGESLSGKQADLLSPMTRATKRGAELTQRLLAYSRQQPLAPQAIDLVALVSGMSGLLSRTLGETIQIEIRADSDLCMALADPGQVENALLNLALNARDAMPEGGKLTIECANGRLEEAYLAGNPETKSGDYAMLVVSDEGVGMTSEVQSHAFEPIFTTKEVGQGSGLGLSMIYGFAEQSGGHVTISSEEGHGTTIKLFLPRAEKAVGVREGAVTEIPRAKGETILVIEDDTDVRQLAVAMLQDLGYRVLQAPDGNAALLLLKESSAPDLLLSDVVLPYGLSGPDVAEKVKRELPAIKLLFMSGYTDYGTHHSGLTESGAELLNKPFRKQELARKVRRALES